MTLNVAVLIDFAIVCVLVFLAWRGAQKGLILALFSFLALFAAWYGAGWVAENYSQPVANVIRPTIQTHINDALEDALGVILSDDSAQDTSTAVPVGSIPIADSSSPAARLSLQQLLSVMDDIGLFTGFRAFLEDAVRQNTIQVTSTASDAISVYLAGLVAKAGLFGLSYLLILLVWSLLSRALDLAFRLPGLRILNMAGGALIALAKGIAMILVILWLARLSGLLTDANTGPVAGMMSVPRLTELLHALVTGA